MKLSIITICFNEKEIRRTCESIVNQSWQDFEWIVVDGGSTDGTLNILNEYKDRINILISEKDNGVYNAMNKGIKLANGEWLSFMNGGDCFYDKNVLLHIFGKNEDFSQYGVIYGHTATFASDKIQKWKKIKSKYYFLRKNLNHQSTFTRKSLFEKYGYFDEDFKICADFDKCCQILSFGEKFKQVDVCVAKFDTTGISCNPAYSTLLKNEKNIVLKRYYSPFILTFEKIRKNFSFGKKLRKLFKS